MRLYSEEFNKSAFDFNVGIHQVVLDICSPLFSNTCIKHFRYMKMYKNYKYLSIGTNLEYLKYYLQNLKEPGKIFEPARIFSSSQVTRETGKSYFIWPNQYSKDIKDPLFEILYEFNVWNGFTVSKYTDDYVETWSFATDKASESTTQFYVNNLSLFDQFIVYFKKYTSEFTKDINDEKLAVFQNPFNLNCVSSDSLGNKDLKDFLPGKNNITMFKFLCENGKIATLSARELECLFYISSGKTMKSIANIMSISPRTVEVHIQSIKRKTNTHYKAELSNLINLDEMILYKQISTNSLH